MKKLLWMRVGTRVLANGTPGEIVSIFSHTDGVDGVQIVDYIDVQLDGLLVECFRPEQVQLDRIRNRREVCHA